MLALPSLAVIIATLLVWLIAAPVHEFAHAWSADRLGDGTPDREGRLTLDPRAHIDPLGTLLVALVGFGWARPVQVNPYYLRYGPRMGMLIVSLAGPLSNLALAVLFALPVRLGLIELDPSGSNAFVPTLGQLWYHAIALNVLLMLFNLLPFAPLDGFKVMLGVLPDEMADKFARSEQWGIFILLLLLATGVLRVVIGQPAGQLIGLLVGAG
jgi:Zn-dependent protease